MVESEIENREEVEMESVTGSIRRILRHVDSLLIKPGMTKREKNRLLRDDFVINSDHPDGVQVFRPDTQTQ
jgi:hypothetical protein